MSEVTAAKIKEVRERTGIAMGKCKEALEEAKGDIELAISNLRKQGLASAVKKEGRETKEGMIAVKEDNSTIALVEANAETDFVIKNDRFQEFLKNITEDAAKTKASSIESFISQKYSRDNSLTIDQYRATMVQTIGENIQIKRVCSLEKTPNKSIGVYSHLGGKIVVVVELEGSGGEEALAKDIAMHIAAASPEYLSPEKVPSNILEQEKEIAKSQVQGKPANIIDKIVEGKINAFYDASCLTCQKYIKDDSITISDLVQKRSKEIGKPLAIQNFIRWNVGQ